MIASHYAEPLLRHLATGAPLRDLPDANAEVVRTLNPGDELWMLDDTRGWAWGYAGPDGRVGYVRAEALAA